jgi:alkylation response protein AidB-like acyl-CoA dehydrogenase
MNFDLNEDQQMFVDLAKQFSDSELLPNAAHWDQNHIFPKEV